MRFSDLLLTASSSLRSNKSRSILTILGIVIGIAAVILMLSIGKSAEGLILSEISDLGADLVFIEPSAGEHQPDPTIAQTLKLKDITAVEDTGYFDVVAPMVQTTVKVSYEEETEFVQVVGTSGDYLTVFPSELSEGRFIDENDVNGRARVAVLGKEIAEDLFGNQDSIDKRIKIKNTSFRVVGVFPEQGTRFFQNLDRQIAVPVTTAQRDVLGEDHITYIVAKALGNIEIAKDEARWALRDSHDIDNPEGLEENDDFVVSSQSDAVEIISVVGLILSILLVSIAAISLIVGGIGIMNIMLVSVSERTKEIGLRKSVGATYKEILQQFLLESVMLTMAGGIIGIIAGVLTSLAIGFIAGQYVENWTAKIPLEAVISGFLVATVVGIVFGIYPARRAAKLDPIEALRYE